jgi:hypothetical protein
MRPLLLSLALFTACVPLNGGNDAGGGDCPDIGCGPSYQVTFQRDRWPAGNYRVEVTADGATNACDIVIPMSCDRPPRCPGTPSWLPMLSGCALDPGQQKIDGVTFERATPASVTVRVLAGDRMLGLGTFAPAFRTAPVASGCTLTCTQAATDVMSLAQ